MNETYQIYGVEDVYDAFDERYDDQICLREQLFYRPL